MSRWGRLLLLIALAGGGSVFFYGSAAAQSQPRNDVKPKDDKQLYKELASPYKKWLDEDVVYVISDEERKGFLQLQTNEEREQYIEAFWQRRNPDQDSPINAFKEEHYRRIAYSNEHFGSGMQGWRTDRGRMYIMWGPPTSKESHTHGDNYDRPLAEGGGSTKTYAWEAWNYNYVEGLGQDVTLEFVDTTGTNEFHLSWDPSEKDAFLNTPIGLTLAEMRGESTKADRMFTSGDGSRIGAPAAGSFAPRSLNQFERMELYAKAFTPPPVKYKDLEALVSSRIVRDQMNFSYRTDNLRITGDTVLVPVTVQVPHRELTYESSDGVHSASVNLFARISTLTGRVVNTFEEEIRSDIPDSLLQQGMKGSSIYQKSLPLRPGLYRLDLVLKDVNSGDVGAKNIRLAVQGYSEEQLTASTLILADEMTPVATREIGLGQFVIGSTKVRPKIDQTFRANQPMGIFLQTYSLKIDETTHKNDATVDIEILQGDKAVFQSKQTSAELDQTGEQITIEKVLAAGSLAPGKYKLQIRVTDNLANQNVLRSADFTIQAVETAAATPAQPASRR
jgi:GWxTD domain-containing protein